MSRLRDTPSPAPLEWGSLFVRWAQDHMRDVFRALSRAEEQSFIVACSDETTALTTGTAKVTFRMPWAFRLYDLSASLTTAQASGSIFTVDVNVDGTSIISTKLTIGNTETTSTTAATAFAFASTDTKIDKGAVITIDIDQIGTSGAKGLKVYFYGVRA